MTENDVPEGYELRRALLPPRDRWFWFLEPNERSGYFWTRDAAIADAHRHKQERESGRE